MEIDRRLGLQIYDRGSVYSLNVTMGPENPESELSGAQEIDIFKSKVCDIFTKLVVLLFDSQSEYFQEIVIQKQSECDAKKEVGKITCLTKEFISLALQVILKYLIFVLSILTKITNKDKLKDQKAIKILKVNKNMLFLTEELFISL